jgi:transposase
MTARKQAPRTKLRRQLFFHFEGTPHASNVAISKRVGVSRNTVARWRGRFNLGDDSLADAPRKGGPLKLSKEEVRRATRHLQRAQHSTVASATDLINTKRAVDDQVSRRTVRRRVAKREGSKLQYTTPVREKVSVANQAKRTAASTRAAIRELKGKLNSLVFLDAALVSWKKGYPIKAFRRGLTWVDKTKPRKQQLGGYHMVQFYAAITKGPNGDLHRHPLVFVPAGKGLTAQVFVKKVAKPLLCWAQDEVFDGPGFQFVQDNASCHTAESSDEWMVVHDYVLHEHPPQSPDLNPIERAWSYFKNELKSHRPRTEAGLHKVMQSVWMGLNKNTLQRFINQLPEAMHKVHACPKKLVQH